MFEYGGNTSYGGVCKFHIDFCLKKAFQWYSFTVLKTIFNEIIDLIFEILTFTLSWGINEQEYFTITLLDQHGGNFHGSVYCFELTFACRKLTLPTRRPFK